MLWRKRNRINVLLYLYANFKFITFAPTYSLKWAGLNFTLALCCTYNTVHQYIFFFHSSLVSVKTAENHQDAFTILTILIWEAMHGGTLMFEPASGLSQCSGSMICNIIIQQNLLPMKCSNVSSRMFKANQSYWLFRALTVVSSLLDEIS